MNELLSLPILPPNGRSYMQQDLSIFFFFLISKSRIYSSKKDLSILISINRLR